MKVVPIARDVAYALRNGLANTSATWRPAVLVFLPFAAGYCLSYLFRTVNALISDRLVADLGLGAEDDVSNERGRSFAEAWSSAQQVRARYLRSWLRRGSRYCARWLSRRLNRVRHRQPAPIFPGRCQQKQR
jgi:hypothetical protein